MSSGRRVVRVHTWAAGPRTCGSWLSTPWSHSMRSVIWVPTASTDTGWGVSRAASTADTTTATAPSHRASQSSRPNGVLMVRAPR